MINALIIALAAAGLAGLLYFEKKEHVGGRLAVKTPLSCLFVTAALVQPHPIPVYFYLLLAGLILCLGGDVFLALSSERMFLFGLVSFLLGHVLYIAGFASLTGINYWLSAGPLVIFVISGLIFFRLRPHLGSMTMPVLAYVIVISLMLSGAWAVLIRARLAEEGRALLFAGAALFYLSDLFVARDRFVKKGFINRLAGLPMYYAGQFLLAFSVGLLGGLAHN